MGNLVHGGKGSFTHVENTIFFDRSLSLKAKGIYCQIRSIENNPDWVFTIRGFASLVKDAEPLSMEELAEADPDFAKLWSKVLVQRNVKRSLLSVGGERPPESEVLKACEEDGYYQRLYASAEERYGRYVKLFEGFRTEGE